MRRARPWSKWATAWVTALLVSACAGAPRDASLPISDPNENANRQVLAANQQILGPVSEGLRATIPGPVHDRLHDLNSNLKEPRILVNNLLQLRFDAAARTTTRFVVNSSLGIGGLVDLAGRNGIAQQSGDFGQTLFVWGVSEGPYVVQSYLGPSTLRDAVGSVVDMAANPLGWLIGTQVALATTQVAVTAGTTTVDAVDRLGQLKTAEEASIDFYSFVRSGYYQMRRAELREAIGLPSVVESPATTDIDDAPDDTGQAVAVAR
jgi:phospholipid-binding lipoprotein MlaA